ncbi:hypothetical protein BCA37_08035 [Mycobacterium sp. djl-10]|nr:hypothetical protein BCA37_08035 [Mycobacterium sp. djl-10]
MFEGCDPGALLIEVESSRLDESAVWAHRMAAIAALLTRRMNEGYDQQALLPDGDPGFGLISGFVRTAAEVGPALGVPPAVAMKIVGFADALDERLPQIYGLLASGRLDWESTKVIINRTANVTDTAIRDVDRNLAAKIATWDCWSRTRLQGAVDRAILHVDPEGAKERRVAADTERRVSAKALPNGMGEIRLYAGAPVIAKVDARLDQMAGSVCQGDPRTRDQRRVDAAEAIADGSFVLACGCGREDCPAPKPTTDATAGAAARYVINVIAPAATVTGDSDEPGFLQGYGVIDADQVRDLADQPGTVCRDVRNPDTDPTAATETRDGTSVLLRHQWCAAMDRWVRVRGLTCSFPFCNQPAWTADLDHSIPFDHQNPLRGGWTAGFNLDPKCRTHHRIKTFLSGDGGWTTTQLTGGTIEWTSPTGRTYRSTPDGAELFDDLAAACRPKPWTRPRDPKVEKATRIAAARAGLAAKQAANQQTRWINQQRAQEIKARERRNDVRFKRLVLSDKRRTASWCPWINDPWEDESITADWRPPPPPPPADDCEEPPF